MIVNDEVERMLKKMATAEFKVLFQHLPGRTEKYHKLPQSGYFSIPAKI
jgi:hypothetical protein